MIPLQLSHAELVALTGYRQRCRQARWLREQLRIHAPLRADGLPVVSRAQVESALARGPTAGATTDWPNWSKIAA